MSSANKPADDFYIGYMPTAPSTLASWLRTKVAVLLVLFVAVPLALMCTMSPFSNAVFEFGVVRDFEGVIYEKPYPVLIVARPGAEGFTVEGAQSGYPLVETQSTYPLVVFGKFGAGSAVEGLDGKLVQLRGTLIYRDDQTMIEIEDGSVKAIGEGTLVRANAIELGTKTLLGEIVDSKCFLGVMKPGNLKPHRACATRCISGGIPPVLLVRGEAGTAEYFMLVAEDGTAVNAEVLDLVAEPIEVTGRVTSGGGQKFLYANPSTYRRVE